MEQGECKFEKTSKCTAFVLSKLKRLKIQSIFIRKNNLFGTKLFLFLCAIEKKINLEGVTFQSNFNLTISLINIHYLYKI